eukprot:gene5666-4801_t
MAALRPRIVGVTETHLNSGFADGEITIGGYQIIRLDRPPNHPSPDPPAKPEPSVDTPAKCRKTHRPNSKRSGGVLVYIEEGVEFDNVTTFINHELELIAFDDTTAHLRYVVVYRRPGDTIGEAAVEALQNELYKGEA